MINRLLSARRVSVINRNGTFRAVLRNLIGRPTSAYLAVRGEMLNVSVWVGGVLRVCPFC